MKAINKNLSLLFITLLSVGGGMFFSFKNDSQIVTEKQKESVSIIDHFGSAMSSVGHQLKTRPITIASASHVQNYKNKPSPDVWSAGCCCTWGPDCETTYESSVGVKQYDWNGNYKEVSVKKSTDKACEETYKTGYEREKDQSRKVSQLN